MKEDVCISNRLMGTEKNLLVDDGYRWVDQVPANAWHLSGNFDLFSDACLDTLARLNQRKIDFSPPQQFAKAMSLLVTGSLGNIPWSHVMPAREHRAFVKKIVNQATEAIEGCLKDYYVNTWVPESLILRNLKPAKISKTKFSEYLTASALNSKAVESFRPGPRGFANTVEYDRFGTRTGRLTVSSGPAILTLKKEYRDMVIPSQPGGKIAYLDFSSLEARVALYEAGGRCDKVDLYEHISQELFSGKVPRKSVKIAVISELYGSGKLALGESLGISGLELDGFIKSVRGYFGTDALCQRVKEQYIKEGHIKNRHGRLINIDEPVDRIFVNSYVQSTGVDVSLLGFSEVAKQLSHLKGVRPLFVLHDALVLDVSEECLGAVESVSHVKVPGYVQSFPLKCEFLEHPSGN